MEQSSSGRLKKMGFEPKATKTLDSETPEEKEVEAREISDVSEEISETAKLRLARTPTQVEIDFPNGMECPSCKENLGLGAIICMACEINVQTGKKLKSKVKKGRNAYAAPKDSTNDLPDDIDCGGIGRGRYWLYLFLANLVFYGIVIALALVTEGQINNALLSGLYIVYLGALIYTIIKRLRNLGSSAWLFLLSFVPLINIWLGYRLSCCPAGYADHRQLDSTGKKIVFFVFILPILLAFCGGIAAAVLTAK
ncbi:hypothetical protein LNTAR_19807 [Lentisphaera araneosa HTCC2155]|jgi:uncharacterized membrane protein YhaH (DUF805 family)|uniref:Uncharacterized protein n=1 Tax=Lentisphaera araneosa HTCC2155 TaxID=313628 RepID=A6DPQ6_9BACT|nr:DUF805 domain-containing protein [Lentisphaera araneosa]EDM26351.1 hypothetical protein LNTAR_19807 [Lentisphaera araneosa HTCC2155]